MLITLYYEIDGQLDEMMSITAFLTTSFQQHSVNGKYVNDDDEAAAAKFPSATFG